MTIELRQIDENFTDKARLYEINNEAFPEWERIPSEKFLTVVAEYGCTTWAIYDYTGTMVGFTCVMHSAYHKIGYIWFLAIAAECRGRGIGSETLRQLKVKYRNSQLILDMEQLIPEASNYNQRISRLHFYEQGGFARAFMGMSYFGMDFELMSFPSPLRLDNFKAMLSQIPNKAFCPRFYPISHPKILFLHGFFASGECVPAVALREALAGKCEVVTPDLPLHPMEALAFISKLCHEEKPNLLIGNSCGSFYAQQIAGREGIPALLGNPYFEMAKFLRERIGRHQYKSSRKDGKQNFIIDETLISEFTRLEAHQFDYCNEKLKTKVWGLFGDNDKLAHYEPLFLQHYTHSFHFPGGHTPNSEEVKEWYVPIAERLLNF